MWLVSTASGLRFVHVLTMLDVNCILDAMHVQRWDSCRLCNFMVKVWRIRVDLIVFVRELGQGIERVPVCVPTGKETAVRSGAFSSPL